MTDKKKCWYAKDKITEDEFIKICNESESMSKAASLIGLHFNTFKRHALKLDCYKTNQSGKGMNKKHNGNKISLNEIIYDNLHPQYGTYKLKNRLIFEGLIENKCSNCEIINWNNKELNMELDHIDGNKYNHHISNLRMLCPNCHAQTPTYRAKNKN